MSSFRFLFSCPRTSSPKIIHGVPRIDSQKVTTAYRQARPLLSVTTYKTMLYVGSMQYVMSLLFASLCYFLIIRLTFYNISFMFVMYFCLLFCCILCSLLFCVLFLLLCRLFPIFVQVYRPLLLGGNPTAVNKYRIIHHIIHHISSYRTISYQSYIITYIIISYHIISIIYHIYHIIHHISSYRTISYQSYIIYIISYIIYHHIVPYYINHISYIFISFHINVRDQDSHP